VKAVAAEQRRRALPANICHRKIIGARCPYDKPKISGSVLSGGKA
jgi:hypothetical protein